MNTDHSHNNRVTPIPAGHRTVTPYLMVHDPKALIDFTVKAFDAVPSLCHVSPEGTVMHAEIQIGNSMIMLGAATPEWPAMAAAIHLYVEDADAFYRRALEAGAVSIMELADQFYGDRSGGVKDPWGNVWWIATHKEDVSEEEFTRRAAAKFGK